MFILYPDLDFLVHPGSRGHKTPDRGSGMNIRDLIAERLETIFGILKSFIADSDPGFRIFLTLP
jgi:hypothetical protein